MQRKGALRFRTVSVLPLPFYELGLAHAPQSSPPREGCRHPHHTRARRSVYFPPRWAPCQERSQSEYTQADRDIRLFLVNRFNAQTIKHKILLTLQVVRLALSKELRLALEHRATGSPGMIYNTAQNRSPPRYVSQHCKQSLSPTPTRKLLSDAIGGDRLNGRARLQGLHVFNQGSLEISHRIQRPVDVGRAQRHGDHVG